MKTDIKASHEHDLVNQEAFSVKEDLPTGDLKKYSYWAKLEAGYYYMNRLRDGLVNAPTDWGLVHLVKYKNEIFVMIYGTGNHIYKGHSNGMEDVMYFTKFEGVRI